MKHLGLPLEISLAGAASDGATIRWAVLKPGIFYGCVGGRIEVRAEHLAEMASAYNTDVERAAINYDHDWGGDAYGWVKALSVGEDGILYADVEDLDVELVEKIQKKKRRRVSAEFTTEHAETGGWYFHGLAVLGNLRGAVKALPEIQAGAGDDPVDQLFAKPVAPKSNLGAAAGAEKEKTMSDPNKTTPPAPQPDANLAELSAQVKNELAAAKADRELAAKERREAALIAATARVDAQLVALKDRVTPAQVKAGLGALLLALATAEQPTNVQFNDGSKAVEKSPYDTLVGILQAQPLLSERLGSSNTSADETADPPAGAFNASEQAYLAAHGIDDKRVKELVAKRPDAFRDPEAN